MIDSDLTYIYPNYNIQDYHFKWKVQKVFIPRWIGALPPSFVPNVHLNVFFNYNCMFLFSEGFDNNGVMIGPRSTRQSNPEEHASHYFNTFSKDMLVQVRLRAHFQITNEKCFYV